jgi:hypothetical protein
MDKDTMMLPRSLGWRLNPEYEAKTLNMREAEVGLQCHDVE